MINLDAWRTGPGLPLAAPDGFAWMPCGECPLRSEFGDGELIAMREAGEWVLAVGPFMVVADVAFKLMRRLGPNETPWDGCWGLDFGEWYPTNEHPKSMSLEWYAPSALPARPGARARGVGTGAGGDTMNTLEHLRRIKACQPAIDWVAAQPDQSPRALWLACKQGEWSLWLAGELGVPIPDAAYRPALLRLLREYAPRTLRAVGLREPAERLEVLPVDVSWADAVNAARAAASVADVANAAWAAAWARSARSARAANAARAARSAARAAAEAMAAERVAVRVAWAANAAPDPEAERQRCADEVRAAMGDAVIEAWERELRTGR